MNQEYHLTSSVTLSALSGIRTYNLMLRRHLRYPLRYKGKLGAADRIQTCSILGTNEVLCSYEHRRQIVREVGLEPTASWLQTRPSTKLTLLSDGPGYGARIRVCCSSGNRYSISANPGKFVRTAGLEPAASCFRCTLSATDLRSDTT